MKEVYIILEIVSGSADCIIDSVWEDKDKALSYINSSSKTLKLKNEGYILNDNKKEGYSSLSNIEKENKQVFYSRYSIRILENLMNQLEGENNV